MALFIVWCRDEEMESAYRMGMSKKAFFESPISCPFYCQP